MSAAADLAEAYSAMWQAALANPHKFETPEWQAYFDAEVAPRRDVFLEASARFRAEQEDGRETHEG